MNLRNFKWELIISMASLFISIIALIYTYKSAPNCSEQTDELLYTFSDVHRTLNEGNLSYSRLESIQNKLRFKIDKLNSSNCGWNDTLNNQREIITKDLWKLLNKVILKKDSVNVADRKVIIGILDTIDLFCKISSVACNERDKNDIDSLRIIYW
jgi:hypothetical protein